MGAPSEEMLVTKKSPLLLRLAVIVFAMVCGIYVCVLCLTRLSISNTSRFVNVQVSDKPCPRPNLEEWEVPYVHYPKPVTYSRAECACHPVRLFAILSTQRSGSGWFETLLNSHMNVSSNGEIFSVKVRRANISNIVETLDKLYNLDWLSSASKNECTAAVGLKWMLNQGLMQHHEDILDYFNKKGVSVIFLFRRNLLRRMISILANTYDRDFKLLNGTHKSHVHSPHEAGILASYKPHVNATTLIPELKRVQKMAAKALGYFNSTRHMLLYYEDVVNNRTKLSDVQDFLRVPRMNLTSRQVKIHKGSLSEQVANWDDVQKTLNGTEFEGFLHADYKL
ncbi:Nodulation protein H [Bienertia sinuspersici]